MEVTESGMVTDLSPLQLENAQSPMYVTELGMVTEVIPLQSENAWLLMEVTEFGMVTLPPFPMYEISMSRLILENIKSPSVIPFIEYAPHGAPVAVPWYSICRIPKNASSPMKVTELGMVTEVRLLQ